MAYNNNDNQAYPNPNLRELEDDRNLCVCVCLVHLIEKAIDPNYRDTHTQMLR